jgi:hypothetical protein
MTPLISVGHTARRTAPCSFLGQGVGTHVMSSEWNLRNVLQ